MDQAKWVAWSLGIWGAVVTALTAALPAFNAMLVFFFGVDLSIEPSWMPRGSLRSVLLICAFSTARMCRVSTQITGKPASARALNSHCDSGPASSPIRLCGRRGSSAPPVAPRVRSATP